MPPNRAKDRYTNGVEVIDAVLDGFHKEAENCHSLQRIYSINRTVYTINSLDLSTIEIWIR